MIYYWLWLIFLSLPFSRIFESVSVLRRDIWTNSERKWNICISKSKLQSLTNQILKIEDVAIQFAENRRKMSPILVTLTSRSDSDFERSNVSLKESKPDGV